MSSKFLQFQPIFRPFFSRLLHHQLKYTSFRLPNLQKGLPSSREKHLTPIVLCISKFSTSSGSDRMGRGSKQSIRAAPSKSLIEDEADLSDWVSGLSSRSLKKIRLYSESENDERVNVEKNGFNGREGGFKRRREGEVGKDSDFSARRGGARGGGNSEFATRRGGSRGGRNGSDRRDGNDYSGHFSGGRGGGNSFGGRDEDRDSSEFSGGGRFSGQLNENRNSSNGTLSRGNEGRRENREGGRGRSNGHVSIGMKSGGREFSTHTTIVTDDDDDDDDDDDKDEDMEEEEGRGYGGFKELIDSDEDDGEDDDKEDEESDRLVQKKSVSIESSKSASGHDSYLSESRFDQCAISPLSLKGIKDAGYVKMTMVQEATLPIILKGKDVLAKAKTGTGKTVAFLLPAIEQVAKLPPTSRGYKQSPILVLVICPTRELASQAASEANKLLKYHPSIGVQVVIGGTRLPLEQKRMQTNPCQILVATPGRLRDHVENTAGFATRLMGVKVLVLDEADHLLDMGFRKDIEKIIAAVPKQRQTLLFSATVPQEVRQICHIALKKDHEYINTVQEGSEDTHAQVIQTHLVAPLDKHFPLLYTMLKDHIADDVNYKILVFCTTAMLTRLVASLLGELKMNVREIHSRKPQSYRTRISDEFRKSKGLILVTSDVSARGVDYPDVTLVVQIGVPADRQQYIHRLGRTGRKGKEGRGILMLAPWEEFFLSNIKDLPISKANEPMVDPDTRKKTERALAHVEMNHKEAAYQAWLGYYNSNRNIGKDKNRLVSLANEFSRSMGLDTPPAIAKQVLSKMGLKNVAGLRSK